MALSLVVVLGWSQVALAGAATDGLAWVVDDYGAARAAATEAKTPLIIDFWAPWCHTCIAMANGTLASERVLQREREFTWLAVDTDKASNAALVAKFPPSAWPTYLVVDPANERVLARLVGAASVRQFTAFLDSGLAAQKALSPSEAQGDVSPAAHLARAERAWLAGDTTAAASHFDRALGAAPPNWDRLPDVLTQRIRLLQRSQHYDECVQLGLDRVGDAGRGETAAAADFIYYLTACIRKGEPAPATAEAALKAARAELERVLAAPATAMSVDDRSESYKVLRIVAEMLGLDAEARLAAQWQALALIEAARKAEPAEAMLYGWPLTEVHKFLGMLPAIVPQLRTTHEALPQEYDPAYRLAWVLHELDRHEDARAPAERAAALSYGPRRVRVLRLLVDIQSARGDTAAHRGALSELIAHLGALPDTQKQPDILADAKASLAAIGNSEPADR